MTPERRSLETARETRVAELAALAAKPDLTDEERSAWETADAGLTRIEDQIARLDRAEAAQRGDEARGASQDDAETERRAFDAFLRGETRAMQVGSGADGGFTVPSRLSSMIYDQLREISPVRRFASVETTDTSGLTKVVNRRGTASRWATETGERTETDTPQLAVLNIPVSELYATIRVTNQLLEDSAADIAGMVNREATEEFAVREGAAFVSGSGVGQPQGFLTRPTSTDGDATRAFGTLEYTPSLIADSVIHNPITQSPDTSGQVVPDTSFADTLLRLMHTLAPSYRAGPGVAWAMNSNSAGILRKVQLFGETAWQPGLSQGQPSTFLGYPVIEMEDMPDIAADTYPVAFGNWALGYMIVDRRAMTLIRDPYTEKGWTHFHFSKRVGGQVLDSNAIKLLKIAES